MRKVKKTRKIDGRKVTRLCRKFNVAPITVRSLQRGEEVELEQGIAAMLVAAGYAWYTGKLSSKKSIPVEQLEPSPIEQEDIIPESTEDKKTMLDDDYLKL